MVTVPSSRKLKEGYYSDIVCIFYEFASLVPGGMELLINQCNYLFMKGWVGSQPFGFCTNIERRVEQKGCWNRKGERLKSVVRRRKRKKSLKRLRNAKLCMLPRSVRKRTMIGVLPLLNRDAKVFSQSYFSIKLHIDIIA